MTEPVSNELLHQTLLEIGKDVKHLKITKLDGAIHEKDLQILRLEIAPIRRDILAIKGYVKYVALTIISAITISGITFLAENLKH